MKLQHANANANANAKGGQKAPVSGRQQQRILMMRKVQFYWLAVGERNIFVR